MTSPEATNLLIRTLAVDVRRGAPRCPTVRRTIAICVGLAVVAAVIGSLSVFAVTADLESALAHHWVYQKLVFSIACAGGAWVLVEDLARPDRRSARYVALLPALLLAIVGAIFDPTGLQGRSATSVPICLGAIVSLALPGLLMLLIGLRQAAATTRPTAAGAAIGLLAGAIGATAYALVCRNDGSLFILVWYVAAIAFTAAVGSLAGRFALAW